MDTERNGDSTQKAQNESFIKMPDLFASIMAVKPCVNPHYFEVKPKAESWIVNTIGADNKLGAKFSDVDVCFLVSIWSPTCDKEALRVMTDWNHWVFLFDDQFDEGHLAHDLVGAVHEIGRMTAIMTDQEPPVKREDNPIRYVFQTIWDRVKKRSTLELQRHWKALHQRYFDGLLRQIQIVEQNRSLTQNETEYMELRRATIGVYPAIALTEHATGVRLQQSIIDHPSLQECMNISAELVLMVNDIVSYKKDQALGVDHNLISLLKAQGLTTQEAFDRIGVLYGACYKRWYTSLAEMSVWGEEIDSEVLKFLGVCHNVALGSLHWSFKCRRYLPDGEQVRQTGMLKLS